MMPKKNARGQRAPLSAAALAAAALLAAPASAETFTRVGDSATFNSSTGAYSFTLSLAPNAMSAGSTAFNMPAPFYSYDAVSGVTSSGGATTGFFSGGYHEPAYGWGGVFQGSGGGAPGTPTANKAPMAAPGQAYEGAYVAALEGTFTTSCCGLTSAGVTINDYVARSVSLLWGDVATTNQLNLRLGDAAKPNTANGWITGANILAAANTLGIGTGIGGSGSFYVTVNSLLSSPTLGFNRLYMIDASTAGTFELAPLSFSGSPVVPNVSLVDVAPSGAPAPVVGATPAGGLLGVGLLGLLGLRRRAARVALA